MKNVTITINEEQVTAEVDPRTTLADFLRNTRRLTGTHLGCEHGVCGACTLLINGVPSRSCIVFAVTLEGAKVQTIEGFESDPLMSAVRNAFHVEHGLQCGFCTAGMLVTARDIATRFAAADEQKIRNELSGNLCRCTGYMGIVNAVQRVLREVPAEQRVTRPVFQSAVAGSVPFKPFTPVAEKQTAVQPRQSATRPAKEAELSKGWNRLTDSFSVARSRAETWQLFSDLPRMASCMPGASLEETDGHNLKGQMRIAFGPIKAGFSGVATIERNDETFTGVLEGGGNDVSSGSRAKGRVTYQLLSADDDKSTVVDLTLEFQLQGALAQFGRSGLVKDFASRLIATFAKNLADELEGRQRSPGDKGAELRITDVIWSIVASRLKGFLSRFRVEHPRSPSDY